MINIIAHRGYWLKENEKNTKAAFRKAFNNGFGVETDIRDFGSSLVISHDIPTSQSMRLQDFFSLYQETMCTQILALNIKSDGLCSEIKKNIKDYNIDNYFVFDMSIPDTLPYLNSNVRFYERYSELERNNSFPTSRDGIWIDAFGLNEIDIDQAMSVRLNNEKICLVSPELHLRKHEFIWRSWKDKFTSSPLHTLQNISICTDFPEDLRQFMKGLT